MAEMNFPAGVDVYDRFTDPDISSLPLITQCKNYIAAGNLAAANAILEANPSLKMMQVNAQNLNQILETLERMQLFILENIQQYLVDIAKYKGDWNGVTKYTKYDVINYIVDGGTQSYMGILIDIPIGTLPTNTQYFISLTMRGTQGASGIGLAPRGVWASTIQYYKDDCSSYDNMMWQCLADNINANPNSSPTYWVKIMDLSKQILFSETEPASTQQGVDDVFIKVLDNDKYEMYRKNPNGTYTIINLPVATHTHTKANIIDFPTSLPANGGTAANVPWDGVTGKPATFPPPAHTHTKANITDFPTSMPPTAHTHTKANITDFPTSLPANGGNADTVDGFHIAGIGTAAPASLVNNALFFVYE